MIAHDPKLWFPATYRFHPSDTLRRLFYWIIAICAYATLVAWLELEYWRPDENHRIRNLSQMHTLLGFVISFVLVFRANTAYKRWWEGRKLWGSLTNTSRNLAMKLAAILPEDDPGRGYFRIMIPAYTTALKNHLRSEDTRIELFDHLPDHVRQKLDVEKHIPNQVAAMMFRQIQDLLHEKKIGSCSLPAGSEAVTGSRRLTMGAAQPNRNMSQKITGEQLLFINAELQSFTDICGSCERIKNTPIPYSYSVFIKKFIMVYIATLPFGYVFNLGYFVVPMAGFIFYVLTSLEIIAEEIEEPFGGDENDLPLSRMTQSIRAHIHEII